MGAEKIMYMSVYTIMPLIDMWILANIIIMEVYLFFREKTTFFRRWMNRAGQASPAFSFSCISQSSHTCACALLLAATAYIP